MIKHTECCDRHPDVPLVYDAKLGQRNAGPVVVILPAGTHAMVICPACMGQLLDFIGDHPLTSHTGTLTGMEKLTYLPRVEPEKPPSDWSILPKPPKFEY